MRVLVNGENQILSKEKNFGAFICRILCQVCRLHPDTTFIFLSSDNNSSLPANSLPIQTKVPLLAKPVSELWHKRNLKSQIKKHNADLLISLNGIPLNADVRQLLIIGDGTSLITIRKAVSHVKRSSRCRIITHSLTAKQKMVAQGLNEVAVVVLPQSPAPIYQPFSWEQRERVTAKHTGGRAYFLMLLNDTPDAHIVNTLKAFSQFKKWQRSNMQLILLGTAINQKAIDRLLLTYKYREDVQLPGKKPGEADYAQMLASCMAMIYFPSGEGTAIVLAEAMQCGTPVITKDTDTLHEAGGDAVLFCDPTDVSRISGEMVKLYKDEKFRNGLSASAKDFTLLRSEENAVRLLSAYIQQTDTR
ncbi:MAG TPA: glycosyltransferase [Agriterribacter sp.]|nr:glycosyltransferase [Chitinophagaceae bacterium]HRP32221.1 glycosyltransferase [Agriterribacter sp.]